MATITLRVFRGDSTSHEMREYKVESVPGMVVLDAIHAIQRDQDPSLACRWNCKAAKCGSCSAEINGHPKLMCKARVDQLPQDKPIVVTPIKAFPVIKDLVSDVSWNYEMAKRIEPLKLADEGSTEPLRMQQVDVDRIQEFRKCIECFLCQNVCHILRDGDRKDLFFGPRQMIRFASLEMHPLDVADRRQFLKDHAGVGTCNITKCCTEVCPEHIHITDNAIIPLKERVADLYFDPIRRLFRRR